MVVQLSKSFVDSRNSADKQEELKDLFMKMVADKGGNIDGLTWKDGKIEINGMPNLALHSFLLQAEELGLSIKYTKKTIIEIS